MVGVMDEFVHLADLGRADDLDLVRLSVRLATTPCGPRFQRHISPDRETGRGRDTRPRPGP